MTCCKKKAEYRTEFRICVSGLLFIAFILSGAAVFGADGSFEYTFNGLSHPSAHHSIAPSSIPVGASGVTDIGMVLVSFRTQNNGDTTSISSIALQATSDGSFDDSWVSEIRVYYEAEGALVNPGEYDHGAGTNDLRADTGGPYTYALGTAFNSGTATISIDPTVVNFTRPGGGANYLYVVFDLSASAGTTTNLGCEITSITYGLPDVGTGSTSNPTAHATKESLDDYTVTASANGNAPATAAQGAANVPVFRLLLDPDDASTSANLKTLKVHRTSGADNYISSGGILLYADDGDGNFEPGTGAGLDGDPVATATLGASTASYATLPLAASSTITFSGRYYFVAVNVDGTNAVIGDTFGLEVENPATDITFEDTIEDDSDVSADYAWVTYSAAGLYEYDQEAYVDPVSTTAIPGSGNEFQIVPADDSLDPTVIARFPIPGEEDVDPTVSINIVFSEGMDVASVEALTSYQLYNVTAGATESFSVSYTAATQTAVLDPTADMTYGNEYRVTVYGTPSGVQDYYSNYMAADDVFTFTIRNEYPDFTEPAVTKNRIGTGANSEALIFVPQPPGGASARVSVQVFTTTGKLVRTFYKNVPWSTIGASPISWDGTNDRGQDLGPGMYFVQVRTPSYKRVLKVMIVR